MLENGSIVRKDEGRGPLDWKATWLISSNLSCIDGIKNFTNLKADFYKDYSGARGHELLKECLDEDFSNWEEADQSEEYLSEPSNVKSYVYIFALFASLIPLGLTIVAYWITWTFQNIHGWTVFSHIVSLFLWYIFLGSAQILSLGEDGAQSSTVGCEFVGVMVHFFFLSTFFWLTMVNFDLWSKFRDLQPTSGNRAEMLPFIGYAIFAWGGPLLIVLTGVILDSMFGRHGHESDCDIILPEYGVTRCHLNKRAEGVYLYFIIGLLILLNVGFFISLILILYRYKQSSAVASRRKSTGRADITSSELFLKLFVVMGCSFALEFISWVVESNTDKTENISWVWIAFDFINILVRAIFIFIIFAWKKQTLIEFKKRCPTACWNICFGRFMPDSEESVAGPSASGMQMTKISTPSVQG
ncbi:unnamed protein product [Allacma fusca]|uniref:G-protein coupled receptors family 2 profile 2 domain-containing protein n=1 Tax=Allacma fusca TaxID=39272 RepID=A0A8J2NZ10_9HEXA|nr:unnamed protein product [Allacma fusca]